VTPRAFAEAPSKAIIAGEHFVVHGSRALAVAIGRTVRVKVEEAPRLIVNSNRLPATDREPPLPVNTVVAAIASEFSFRPCMRLDISSSVPDGAGLGSSASTMVAVAAAVARYHSIELSKAELVRFAMLGEAEIHGNPSGVDVNICVYGGAILFRMGTQPRRVRLEAGRRLLIAYSGRQRSTRTMIDRVSQMKEQRPSLFRGLTGSIDEISLLAAERLSTGDMAGLGSLLTLNHAVLSFVGVSDGRLDDLVEILLSLGCFGAKLTGAGGGGSVIAVAPERKGNSIISQLARRGFEAFETEVPVKGVRSWLEQ
jgi:mevalonate kinase